MAFQVPQSYSDLYKLKEHSYVSWIYQQYVTDEIGFLYA